MGSRSSPGGWRHHYASPGHHQFEATEGVEGADWVAADDDHVGRGAGAENPDVFES
jgi:hypothetical protein